MKTTTKERQRMREERRWPTAPEDLRALLDDLDEALTELAALRAVAEAGRRVYEDGVHDLGCAKVRMAEGEPYVSESRDCDCAVATLRAALRAWEERER